MQGKGTTICRRRFAASAAAGLLAAATKPLGVFAETRGKSRGKAKRVLVLGIDGMSPHLLQQYVTAGRMPNFRDLMNRGSFRPLRSSVPPQSPVAWSNFITGMNPGKHGIYDFIHRNPATLQPYLSTSRTFPARSQLSIGRWRIPLRGGGVELLRRGPAFWKILSDAGVPCTLYRLPANFPPVPCSARTISGLGTPDMQGAYGVSFYITDLEPQNREAIRDSEIEVVDLASHKCEAFLLGPKNPYYKDAPTVRVGLTIHRDPEHPVARISIQGARLVLNQGEWSDWVRVRFDMHPLVKDVTGICRFFLKEVHPHFKLYISPINIDPANPAMPISTPPEFSRQLADAIGPFYTQGIAEDTKALSSGLLTETEYLQQARYVFQEDLEAYEYLLKRFDAGLLFFYFSTLDLNSHMYWRAMDPRHPLYTPELGDQLGQTIEDLYARMDDVLGRTLSQIDDRTTLIILSDHGFSPFYRTFNVNRWLLENGYVRFRNRSTDKGARLFSDTDWGKTYAYGLGINSLYINLEGREAEGCVGAGRAAEALVDELVRNLESEKDPETGEQIIAKAYKADDVYGTDRRTDAPDIILGFSRGYRTSWGSILGDFEDTVVADNTDKWSGDHCMDVRSLSGVLLSNRQIADETPALTDLAPTILAEYGCKAPEGTEGKAILEPG